MSRRILLLVIALLSVSALGLLFIKPGISVSSSNQAIFPSPSSTNSYDPANYNLPSSIAGYKTFAVLTFENTACMAFGEKRLVLQASQPEAENFLKESGFAAIKKELQEHGFTDFAESNIEFVGQATTFSQFIKENEKWNEDREKGGCVTLGPMVIVTPTHK